ncbi:MAG: hypothetical protein LBU42_05945 [Prevotellaceae bacterium]|jgi:hypothetical protein|nr:hypothetical protein [Prevotellaceae bacterium]
MKKILLSFLSLMGVGFSAFAQSHIKIEPLSATYTTPAVQFRVSWNAISSGTCHNSKIWVWVDFIKIENNQPSGTWTRATVANPSPGTVAPETDKGFWLQGNSGSYSQTVTVALTDIPANTKFNWCAYASDCPPNITFSTQRDLTMTGTIPFIITYTDNSTVTVSANSFTLASGKTFKNITDATFCPSYVNNTINGIIPTVGTDKGSKAISCSGSTLYVQSASNGNSPWLPNNHCPEGWRWPTYNEMKCFWSAGSPANIGYAWNTEEYSTTRAWSMKPCCGTQSVCYAENSEPKREYAAYYNYTIVKCNLCGTNCCPAYMLALNKTATIPVHCVKN